MNILLIGEGEIGKAIKKIEENAGNEVDTIEIDYQPKIGLRTYDVCHVCIPYSEKFKEIITKHLNTYKPNLTIINSTVKPGTTKRLIENTDMKIVHSPCIGVHPNLFEGIMTFTKMVGSETAETGELACEHFNSIEVDTILFSSSKSTEIGKTASTTYYGYNIIYMKYLYELCEKNNVDFEEVYTKFNEIYNEGYKKLGKTNVIRPILKFMPGKISGHCVLSNCDILKDDFELAKLILRLDDEFEQRYKRTS